MTSNMISIRKLIQSFKYAITGIHYAFRNEQNLVIHLIIATLVMAASIIFRVTPYEMGILGLTMLMVIAAEMVNTALEKMVDLITKEHRVEAMIAKDVASGMVLITAIGSVIIGLLIFIPHILEFIK
jgi:diacylglycerol kinase (ATP)